MIKVPPRLSGRQGRGAGRRRLPQRVPAAGWTPRFGSSHTYRSDCSIVPAGPETALASLGLDRLPARGRLRRMDELVETHDIASQTSTRRGWTRGLDEQLVASPTSRRPRAAQAGSAPRAPTPGPPTRFHVKRGWLQPCAVGPLDHHLSPLCPNNLKPPRRRRHDQRTRTAPKSGWRAVRISQPQSRRKPRRRTGGALKR